MQMRFQHITPNPFLKKYIDKIWIFESDGQIPVEDVKLVVPNGRVKLLIPIRNGIAAKINDHIYPSEEHRISLIGLVDGPCIVETGTSGASGTIGVEFSPQGAYHFFRLPLGDIQNQVNPLVDVLGKIARRLEDRITNTVSIDGKILLLQQFLLKEFQKQPHDQIFEYCIEKIILSKGKIPVNELEKKTGYSSRWLNMKFNEKIGISPKNLSSIIRFKQYYQAVANNEESTFMQNEFYDYYYDLSHFTKDFKRFTGLPHKGFKMRSNDFGKIFYKD